MTLKIKFRRLKIIFKKKEFVAPFNSRKEDLVYNQNKT